MPWFLIPKPGDESRPAEIWERKRQTRRRRSSGTLFRAVLGFRVLGFSGALTLVVVGLQVCWDSRESRFSAFPGLLRFGTSGLVTRVSRRFRASLWTWHPTKPCRSSAFGRYKGLRGVEPSALRADLRRCRLSGTLVGCWSSGI